MVHSQTIDRIILQSAATPLPERIYNQRGYSEGKKSAANDKRNLICRVAMKNKQETPCSL